jgi:hypothetical protein
VLIQEALRQVNDLHTEDLEFSTSPYSAGYRDAILMCKEIIQDIMWSAGHEPDEEAEHD